MNYTYTLNGTAVNPTGKWEIEHHQNEGQIFWRRKLTGELTFKGVDYDLINSFVEDVVSVENRCTYIDFVIYCEGVEFWTGQFKYPYSFRFDTDSCIVSGTPEVEDEYTCIMNKYEQEYDGIDVYLGMTTWHTVDVKFCTAPFIPTYATFLNVGLFSEFIDNLITYWMKCDIDIVSSFFYLDNYPDGTVYPDANNYVTGAADHLSYIHIYPGSYVRSTLGGINPCEDDELPVITFKIIEGWLRDRFNAYWYIDQNGDFRIEHVSFFMPGFAHSDFDSQIDLTALVSGCNTIAERKNKYKYLTDKLYDQERWEWQHYKGTEAGEVHGTDFEGAAIYYGSDENEKSDCVFGEFKEKVIITNDLWTDIYWATQLADPDSIECSGWVLLDCEIAVPNEKVTCEVGEITTVNQINGHLSTANLMSHYFRYDRIFLHGNMNNNDEVFESAQKIKLQDEIEFPLCCDTEFDAMKAITTELGEGVVHSAVQTPYTVKVQLLYD